MPHFEDYDAPRGHIPHPQSAEALYVRRVLIAVLIVVLLVALWRVSLVLILIFGGILVAVALRNLSEPLRRYLRIPDRLSLLITTVALGIVAFAFFAVFGTLASQQFSALVDQTPGAVESARAWLNGSSIGQEVLRAMENSSEATVRLLGALPLAGGILGGIGEVILVIFVGIYFAADPPTYIAGVLRLMPPRRRLRARQILDAISESLRKWLIGMTLDMLLLGVMTGIGMWLIGVPLPFALAVLSGVAVFVPYIGPLIATIPGLLLALSVRPSLAIYAAIVYLIVLTIEGNISQPLLQRWTVSLPPVVNLLAILVFAPLFGIWGAVLATPLAVVLSVLLQKVYIEDVLDDRVR
ncbi:MAG: AI-2E family transporter [Rhizomicrobium sp.]|jgi:predicted PurR-regulated permease PerM